MFFEPLDVILGARSKVRLLRALTPLSRPVSGREAARLAGVSHIAIGALDELVHLRVVDRREAAGQNLYTFNRGHVLGPVLVQLFEEERQRVKAIFRRLAAVVRRVDPSATAVVFGSAARGEAEPDSDFDVLVVVKSAALAERMHAAMAAAAPELSSRFGLRLSPVVLTAKRARKQRAEGGAFITEVLRDARQLTGRPLAEVVDD
ncbi:MAG: nucleotidyltransferase domain-containing protein [Myxococcaceae bacterium]